MKKSLGIAILLSVLFASVAFAHGPGFKPRLASFDANGDGKVTQDEAVQAAKRHFGELDQNHDGVLDRDELSRGRFHGRGHEHRRGPCGHDGNHGNDDHGEHGKPRGEHG